MELLTVLAILAILATLLSTSLVSAKRKARQAACMANLRQIALAIDLYLDDQRERPDGFLPLVSGRYLPNEKSFRCPEDRDGNWGALVEGTVSLPAWSQTEDLSGKPPPTDESAPEFVYSYLSPLRWEQWAWDRLNKFEAIAGVVACQLHGVRRWKDVVSLYAYEGLLLRAQRDGAVIRRQLFWREPVFDSPPHAFGGASLIGAPGAERSAHGSNPWELFIDLPMEQILEP